MSKSLVIVESPAKAKTISKYLGPNYIVESSVGHIRDLPKKASSDVKRFTTPKNISPEEKARLKSINERKRLIRRMGIDPDNGWEAVWQIIPEKEKVIKNDYGLLGGVIEFPNSLYFVKAVGINSFISENSDNFRQFVYSIKLN